MCILGVISLMLDVENWKIVLGHPIAHHDCRDGKQHLTRRESRTRKLLMYKKAVDSPVAVLERMYKHKPERSCRSRTDRIDVRVA